MAKPSCSRADARALSFADQSADVVLFLGPLYHLCEKSDREKALGEAWRVLKPRGRLVLSDILFKSEAIEGVSPYLTADNHVKDLSEYETLYRKVGFKGIELIDATEECWKQFDRHYRSFLRAKFLTAGIDRRTLNRTRFSLFASDAAINFYLLVSAQKPG